MADKLPLVVSAGVAEQLKAADTLGITVASDLQVALVLKDDEGTAAFEIRIDKDSNANTLLGKNAGANIVTDSATSNTLVGRTSGAAVTTGDHNVGLGSQTLALVTTGGQNIGVGTFSFSTLLSGDGNTGVGYNTYQVATGSDNTGIGRRAGRNITTGNQNVFIGSEAGFTGQTVGVSNSIGIGYGVVTTASNEVILGNASITKTTLRGIVEGDNGTFVYAPSPFGIDNRIVRSDGTGDAVQFSKIVITDLHQIIFPDSNILLGDGTTGASIILGVGVENILIGNAAGEALTTGTNNVFLGDTAGKVCVTGNNNMGIGDRSLSLATGSDNTGVGRQSGALITTGGENVFLGANAGNVGQLATALNSIGIGKDVVTTASNQIVIGNSSHTVTILRGTVIVNGDIDLQTFKLTSTAVLVVEPGGTGPLQGDSSGDARGVDATDWQRSRTASTQVASGSESVIAGGSANTAGSAMATISGGSEHTIDASSTATVIAGGFRNSITTSNRAVVCGGNLNDITNSGRAIVIGGNDNNITDSRRTFIGGGSVNAITSAVADDSEYAFIGGGETNVIADSLNGCIVGGQLHNITDSDFAAIGGGSDNDIVSTSDYAVIAGGLNNDISGANYGAIPGGRDNDVTADYGLATGFRAIASQLGERAHANDQFAAVGDAQVSHFIIRKQTIDAATTVSLALNGVLTFITVPTDTMWHVRAEVSALRADGSQGAAYTILAGVRRDASAAPVFVGAQSAAFTVEDDATWTCVLAIATNDLVVNVTGAVGVTINWVAHITVTQVRV